MLSMAISIIEDASMYVGLPAFRQTGTKIPSQHFLSGTFLIKKIFVGFLLKTLFRKNVNT